MFTLYQRRRNVHERGDFTVDVAMSKQKLPRLPDCQQICTENFSSYSEQAASFSNPLPPSSYDGVYENKSFFDDTSICAGVIMCTPYHWSLIN